MVCAHIIAILAYDNGQLTANHLLSIVLVDVVAAAAAAPFALLSFL